MWDDCSRLEIVGIRLSEWLFDPYSCFDQWEAKLEELRLM